MGLFSFVSCTWPASDWAPTQPGGWVKRNVMIARDGLGEQRLPEEDQAFPSPGVSFLLCRCFPDEPRSWDRRPNVRQRQRQRQRHTTQFEAKTKTKTDDPMWGKDKRPNVRTKRVFLLLTNSIICFKTKYNLRKIQRANKNDITPPKEEVSRVFFTSPALR